MMALGRLGHFGEHVQIEFAALVMKRCAFTLIEMLVSLAITLMIMAAVVTLFQNVTDSISGSR